MSSKFILVLVGIVLVCVVSGISSDLEIKSSDRSFKSIDFSSLAARTFNFKKKSKYLIPILAGVLIIKLLFLPLVLKVITFMTGLSIVMSAASLVISALVNTMRFGFGANDKQDTNMPMVDKNLWGYVQDVANSTIYPYKSILPMHK